MSNELCPFDELGCKFRQNEIIKLEETDDDTDSPELKNEPDDNLKYISVEKV